MEYGQLRSMETTHCCATCGGNLVTIWNDTKAFHILVCAEHHEHKGFERRPSVSESFARGELDKELGAGHQKDLEQLARRIPERFNLLPKKDFETGATITIEELGMLITFAASIGLDAFLGHVGLFYSTPRITVDGYYYLTNKHGRDISVAAVPATKDEYASYKVPDDAYFSIARGWEDGKELKEVGLGIVTQQEIAEMSTKHPDQKRHPIVTKYPQRMAEKRAEWQLLRKLIPLEVRSETE